MYELLVLSLLMHWPLHAYRIIKIANAIIGPEESVSSGTLSSLLTKLVKRSLIAPTDVNQSPFPPDRSSRVFVLTSAGRERFLQLMLDTTSHSGPYRRLFHIKALHLEFLPLESQLFLVEHYLTYCKRILDGKQADKRDVAGNPIKQEHMSSEFRAAVLTLMYLKQEQWQLEITWAQSLRERLLTRFKQQRTTMTNEP